MIGRLGELNMSGLLADIHFGFRLLRKSPEVTTVAVIAMAIAIGVAGTIFSVVNTVLIQPLPCSDPARLVSVWQVDPANPATWQPAAAGNYVDWHTMSQSFEKIGAAVNVSRTLTSFDEPETPLMQMVSSGYFDVLGIKPILGRTFTTDEDIPGAKAVLVLSYELWQRRFNSDLNIIGQTTELDGQTCEIIGVMPEGFDNPIFGLTERPQVWLQLTLPQSGLDRRGKDHYVIARLASGRTVNQAQQEMTRISEELKQQHPDTNRNVAALVAPLKESVVRGVRPAVLLLLGAVFFVLLIASSNVAHLLLARSVAREQEFALRRALGAGTGRLVRQLIVESLSLMMLCTIPGLLLTIWGTQSVGLLIPAGLNIPHFDFIVDSNVIVFTLAISIIAGVVLGLVPAIYARRVNLVSGLVGAGRTSGSFSSQRIQKVLVVGEIALSLSLLICAGLMVQSFRNLQRVDQGFDPANVLTFRVSTRGAEYKESQQRARFFKEVRDSLSTMPGVLSVGMAQFHPFYPQFGATIVALEGEPVPEPGKEPRVSAIRNTPDYFSAMKIPLLQGRLFSEYDTDTTQLVVVVSAKMAHQMWGNADPIGKRLAIGNSREGFREVVGVVGDVRTDSFPPDPQSTVYLPMEQDTAPTGVAYVLRTADSPLTYVDAAKKKVWSIDRSLPVFLVRSMEEIVSGMDWRTRFVMSLLAIFSVLSLLLAITGIYAALSYVVSKRAREIGIRMALGAQKGDVLKLLFGQGIKLTFLGIALGALASFALTRVMSNLLFGISSSDAMTFVTVSALLTGVAAIACLVPARRATKVDPIIALKSQ